MVQLTAGLECWNHYPTRHLFSNQSATRLIKRLYSAKPACSVSHQSSVNMISAFRINIVERLLTIVYNEPKKIIFTIYLITFFYSHMLNSRKQVDD